MRFIILLLFLSPLPCLSESKDQFTFLNPTPLHLLREFETERPDKTKTPYTIDAGHIAVESEISSYFENEEKHESGLRIFDTNVRIGITNNSEFQIQIEPYIHRIENFDQRNEKTRDGIGNTTLRYKYNMQGNDSERVAVAIMPFVIIPTASAELKDEKIEHGFTLPLNLKLTNNWRTGFMLQIDTESTRDETDWQSNLVTSWSVKYNVKDYLIIYAEIYNEFQRRKKTTNVTTFDLAIQYELNNRLRLDIGTFIGLSPEAEDIENFIGTSILF
jgi:hypothetical protein